MPKIVDHEKRRNQIAEAAWRVVLERGMEGATVRNIAKEAQISLGALRHYFSSQDELLVYTMKLVKEQATARINEIASQDLPPKEVIQNILFEIVPITKDKMAEMEVWFSFIAYARHQEDVLDVHNDGIYIGMQKLIDYLAHSNLLRKGLNIELETERLYALIDGISLHAMLEPKRVNEERIKDTIIYHLNSIFIDS